VPGAGLRFHHYLQHWSWGKSGCVFRFQNPIRRFDFPIELLCFRFSARFLAFHWLTILLGPIKVFQRQSLDAPKKRTQILGKTDEKRTLPLKTQLQFCK
jgi:hypothetical protein